MLHHSIRGVASAISFPIDPTEWFSVDQKTITIFGEGIDILLCPLSIFDICKTVTKHLQDV